MKSFPPSVLLFGALLLMSPPAPADDRPAPPALAGALKSYFATTDAAQREALARAIAADPAYRPANLGEALNRLPLWPALSPGAFEIDVKVGFGQVRTITLRIPKGYRPDRPWPLLLCYHSSGSNGPSILRHTEQLLGPAVDQYVLAAPSSYRQTSLDAPPPFTPEHPLMVREIKKAVHVDSDRVFALGYSLGGYMAWTLALFHSDLFAGAMPMASTISVPGDLEGGWQQLPRNLAHLPVLHVWGSADRLNVPGFEGRNQFAGTMASFNESFSPLIAQDGFTTITENRIAGAGHGGANPRPESLAQLLQHTRVRWPKKVQHQYRHLHQGSAYWLEANAWQGDGYFDFDRKVERRQGESWPQAYGRVFLPLLGELSGEVQGQKIVVKTRHVGELTVWLAPELIDLEQPIEIELDGKKVFTGKVAPDLAVALAQAERTRDFERLRWAGVRIDASGQAKVVDSSTSFAPLLGKP